MVFAMGWSLPALAGYPGHDRISWLSYHGASGMIQNTDINVGPGHYKNLTPDEILVTSIWYSIQGEGPHAGKPALFIRLAGCNRGRKEDMGCAFCDTKFTFSEGVALSVAQIEVEAMRQITKGGRFGSQLPIVVITGGEPMMQENLRRLVHHLIRYDFPHVQIESNGDKLIASLDTDYPSQKFSLVVSPKVVGNKYRAMRPDVWQFASALKFVISGDSASPYFNVPDWASSFPREVYLSPLAEYREGVKAGEIASGWDHRLIDPELTQRNYQRAGKLALELGFRVSIQQHLFLGMP